MGNLSTLSAPGNFTASIRFGENKAKQMVKAAAQKGGKEVGDFFTGNHLERSKDRWAWRGTLAMLALFATMIWNASRNAPPVPANTSLPPGAPSLVAPPPADGFAYYPQSPEPAPYIRYDAASGVLQYTVRPGDWLSTMAQDLKAKGYLPQTLPDEQIVQMFVNNPQNGITDPNRITAGATYAIRIHP